MATVQNRAGTAPRHNAHGGEETGNSHGNTRVGLVWIQASQATPGQQAIPGVGFRPPGVTIVA